MVEFQRVRLLFVVVEVKFGGVRLLQIVLRVFRSRVGIDIPSKSKIVVSPQSVGGAVSQQFPERIGCKGGSSPARVALSQQQ